MAAGEFLMGAHEGPAGPGSACTDSFGQSLGTAGKCVGRSAATLRRRALGSVSGSFTPVLDRSPATAGILSVLVTNTGGRW